MLLEAARLAPEVDFVVAGEGPLRPYLERTAAQNVQFVGHCSSDELARLISTAVAVASPSVWYENAPISVLEAMRGARAVILSGIGGQPELIEDGGGAIVAPGSPVELADAVRRFWHDRRAAAQLGDTARQVFLDRFTLDRHLDRLEALYGLLTHQ